MKRSTHTRITATLLATIAAVVLLLASSSAQAACPGIKIRNNTGCLLSICFYNTSFATSCMVIGPNSSAPAPWAAGFMPIGVQSAGGFFYPWGTGCTVCLTLNVPGTTGTCCVQVCPNVAQCAVDINPCSAPCNP